jgi:hypothetical protein
VVERPELLGREVHVELGVADPLPVRIEQLYVLWLRRFVLALGHRVSLSGLASAAG